MGDPLFKSSGKMPLGGLFGLGSRQAPATSMLLGGQPLGSITVSRSPAPVSAHTNRRVFFSFHFDDILRVNNVRKAFQFVEDGRDSTPRFFDSSLWEEKKLTNPEAIKNLIRYGVGHTSVVCVLVGTSTWSREWVRYEIARAVVENRGLLAVHLNGINHHSGRGADPLGPNPLAQMGLYKQVRGLLQPATWHLCEWAGRGWVPYRHYSQAVSRPVYLPDAAPGEVVPLSLGTAEYCYAAQLGCMLIGKWIDHAAKAVGR